MRDRRVNHQLRRENAALDLLEADQSTRNFYRDLVRLFADNELPFLVGGTFAIQRYTGIARRTKDIDFFIRREDFERFRATCRKAGFYVELTYPHWLGKVFKGQGFADLAFRSANGEAAVDDDWFRYSVEEQLWGIPIRLCPPEETIWSKAFLMERERFDGADVVHIIHATGRTLDWSRLVARFGEHWRILLVHLITFGFVYPNERDVVPAEVMRALLSRAAEELSGNSAPDAGKICYGTLISREQYLTDIHEWGYADARLTPRGNMTEEEVEHWTAAIDR